MKLFSFDPDQSFRQVRRLMGDLNGPEHKEHLAKLTWLEGNQAQQSVTFLWDSLAERFGLQIEKEPIDVEIISSLVNGIPLQVEVFVPKKVGHRKP